MSTALNFAEQWRRASVAGKFSLMDPGDAGGMRPQIRNPLWCGLISAGSGETRKLFPPIADQQELRLYFNTDGGGDVVVSCRNQADSANQACDQSGNNTITFATAGDSIVLVSFLLGSSYVWRVQGSPNGAVLSTV